MPIVKNRPYTCFLLFFVFTHDILTFKKCDIFEKCRTFVSCVMLCILISRYVIHLYKNTSSTCLYVFIKRCLDLDLSLDLDLYSGLYLDIAMCIIYRKTAAGCICQKIHSGAVYNAAGMLQLLGQITRHQLKSRFYFFHLSALYGSTPNTGGE